MNPVIEVGTAEYAIGYAGQTLMTIGVGSCLVICLYDTNKKIGALVHVMLPHSENGHLNPLRFTDTALEHVLADLWDKGVQRADLEAHLIGGASMFVNIEDYLKIGEKNIQAAQTLLEN